MNKTGAEILDNNSCLFSVWAPEKDSMILHIIHPGNQEIQMTKNEQGYFTVIAENINNGCRYFYKPNGEKDYPDPGSHFQPEGVHGPSEVINHESFKWKDQLWRGIPVKDLIFYEIHVGTFTPGGTFESIIPVLDELSSIGINAIEIMPVSQFPGSRNWGYDGVFPYAVQNSYGGPDGFKIFVNACHSKGIAVFLDVVYNHMGPEGNYFSMFGPYFTGKYRVPWGDAINFDEGWSDGVREYFSCNVCHWFSNYHLDGLRVDAIHMIYDSGAVHFWELTRKKLEQMEQKFGRRFYLIAESDLNSPKVIKPVEYNGYGFDAQWLDDFHHALYVLLDRKGKGRYADFGRIEQLAKAYTDGFVHSGEMVKFRKRKHGASSAGIAGEKFVVFNQNHDQIGNRVQGERLSVLIDFNLLKVASAALFLSPYIPLLFMGEEYGEDNPFFYFVSHTDEEIVKAVREGRRKEFEGFHWKSEPPDPQDKSTFERSKIDREKKLSGNYRLLLEWNKKLVSLRRNNPAIRNTDKNGLFIYLNHEDGFILSRKSENEEEYVLCIFNLSESELTFHIPALFQSWFKILDSEEGIWNRDKKDFSSPVQIRANQNLTTHAGSVVVYSNKDQRKYSKN